MIPNSQLKADGYFAAVVLRDHTPTTRWRPVCWDNHQHKTAEEATECARKWIKEHK